MGLPSRVLKDPRRALLSAIRHENPYRRLHGIARAMKHVQHRKALDDWGRESEQEGYWYPKEDRDKAKMIQASATRLMRRYKKINIEM